MSADFFAAAAKIDEAFAALERSPYGQAHRRAYRDGGEVVRVYRAKSNGFIVACSPNATQTIHDQAAANRRRMGSKPATTSRAHAPKPDPRTIAALERLRRVGLN